MLPTHLVWRRQWLTGSPPLLGSVKLNFDGCSLGNLGQIGIGGVIRGYLGTVLRPFSKHVKMRLAAR